MGIRKKNIKILLWKVGKAWKYVRRQIFLEIWKYDVGFSISLRQNYLENPF